MVMELCKSLPEQYTAEPCVKLGKNFEVDICTFDVGEQRPFESNAPDSGVATAVWVDQQRGRELVAAIEIVSPANKDRPETRQAFVSKCAALLQKKICVSIVDLGTVKNFNLYCEVLDVFGQTDPAFAPDPPSTYAVTCRSHSLARGSRFESWAYPMVVGRTLPVLPIWLNNDHAISLELEASYQQTCRALRLI